MKAALIKMKVTEIYRQLWALYDKMVVYDVMGAKFRKVESQKCIIDAVNLACKIHEIQ